MKELLVTKIRVWFQDRGSRPDLGHVNLTGSPIYGDDCVDISVVGNGYDLKRFIVARWDVFVGYLQMKPEVHADE